MKTGHEQVPALPYQSTDVFYLGKRIAMPDSRVSRHNGIWQGFLPRTAILARKNEEAAFTSNLYYCQLEDPHLTS